MPDEPKESRPSTVPIKKSIGEMISHQDNSEFTALLATPTPAPTSPTTPGGDSTAGNSGTKKD